MGGQGWGAGRELAHQQAPGGDLLGEIQVARRVGPVEARTPNGERWPAGLERTAVAGGVYPQSHAARDGEPAAGEVGGELLGVAPALDAGVAAAHHGELR